MTSITLRADECEVGVLSANPSVVSWIIDYLHDWWVTFRSPIPHGDRPAVRGTVDSARLQELLGERGAGEAVRTFLGVPGVRYRTDDAIIVVVPAQHLAYVHELSTGAVEVIGDGPDWVALRTVTVAREMMTASLEAAGWVLFHGGCIAGPDGAALVLGRKGSGKTTTTMCLVREADYRLVGNDRCFVRADGQALHALPWPGSMALGLGLLAALSWAPRITRGVRAGVRQHPFQRPEVTAALRAGRYRPLYGPTGKEWKYELFPNQLVTWFGGELSTGAEIHRLFLPHFDRADPDFRLIEESRESIAGHIITEGTVDGDSYPNVLQLPMPPLAVREASRDRVLSALVEVPHVRVSLGLQLAENSAVLRTAMQLARRASVG